jgi:hypothetical protein
MPPTPPQNDPAERAKALEEALEARQKRAQVKSDIAEGKNDVPSVLDAGARGNTDEVGSHARIVGRLKVGDVIMAVDEVGPKRAAQAIAEAEQITGTTIDPDQRIDTLSSAERDAITQVLTDHGWQ